MRHIKWKHCNYNALQESLVLSSMWEVKKRFLYRLCLPRRVTPSIEYLMYTCDQAFCDHKYSVLWSKTKGGLTILIQWKYIIQILTWNIVFHSSLFTFKLIPSNLGHQLKMTLQLPHTFRPHKVIITILKFFSILLKYAIYCLILYDICHLITPTWHFDNIISLQRSYKQKPPPGKTRNVERETGHVLRFRFVLRFWNFLLKTISKKLFYFE